MSEIERAEMMVKIYKESYNNQLNYLLMNLAALLLNLHLMLHGSITWLSAIAVGITITTSMSVGITLLSEYQNLKFYTDRLLRAKWNDHEEIERLNSLTKYHNQFFTMDKIK